MRCIARFDNEEQGRKFFHLLQARGIDAQIDQDEGRFEIWVKGEDQIPTAFDLYKQYLEGKEIPQPHQPQPKLGPEPTTSDIPVQAYASPLTRFFILICTVIFLVSLYQSSQKPPLKDALFPQFPPIQQQLMYDYPVALTLAAELTEKYQMTAKTPVAELPPEGQQILQKMHANPPWEGFYTVLLDWKDRDMLLYKPKWFSNIREGEVWRLFTPTILHVNFLHILFNMLWLWLLGKMIERNLSMLQTLLFIVVAGVVTNTCQYFMTGPFFMGFSGVVAAMAGYIWVRKKLAPWEVYPIDSGTLIFLWVFIFGMLLLQVVAFFLEILHSVSFSLNIANTAHVSGVALGMLFGRVFKRKA